MNANEFEHIFDRLITCINQETNADPKNVFVRFVRQSDKGNYKHIDANRCKSFS